MRRFLTLLTILLTGLGLAGAAHAQSVVKTENVRAELVSEASAVKPGEPFWVALRQTIRPKWHTYWKNPGDSGLPTEIVWTLPAGAKAEPIVWPTPKLANLSGIINYGYGDDVLLLVRITPPAQPGEFRIVAEANWLVCDDVCIPEEAKFEFVLPVGTETKPADAATLALFDKTRREVPVRSPGPARYGASRSGAITLLSRPRD
jgi:DsbC/DsbD-like thiol-disulfide interchange protein